MGEEYEVASEQGFRFLVHDREIAVAMRGRPRLQAESPRAELELLRILDLQGRRDEAGLVDQRTAQDAAEGVEIERAVGRECPRQALVANKNRSFARKGRI